MKTSLIIRLTITHDFDLHFKTHYVENIVLPIPTRLLIQFCFSFVKVFGIKTFTITG